MLFTFDDNSDPQAGGNLHRGHGRLARIADPPKAGRVWSIAATSAAMTIGLLALGRDARAASLEAALHGGYGSGGSQSPVAYQPAALVIDPGPIWNRTSSPWGGGLVLGGQLGVRFGSLVSVGFDAFTRSSSAGDPGDPAYTDLSRSAWGVGPYVRLYVPYVPFVDPWVSVGVAYVHDQQTYKAPIRTNVGNLPADWTLEHHGVGVPITLGADYSFAMKVLAIGPFFQLTPTFGAGGCAKASFTGGSPQSFCTDESDQRLKVTQTKSYVAWQIGLNVRVTFPPP